MKSLREVMTQMLNTGQPLPTKNRWTVIGKKIVFGNGVIPCEYTGDAIIYMLEHMMPQDIYFHKDKFFNKIAQAITKAGVYNYPGFILAS